MLGLAVSAINMVVMFVTAQQFCAIVNPLVMATEPLATAVLLIIFGILMLIAVLSSRAMDRLGIPTVLLLLILGMLGGTEGFGGIWFHNFHFAYRLGTIALVLILFEGGFNTTTAEVRKVLWASSLLATLGVVLTAALTAGVARLCGLSLSESMLIRAVVSSTDAAAVFSVLRAGKLNLKPRLVRLIEIESCFNDPTAVMLTTLVIAIIEKHKESIWKLLLNIPIQLGIGAAAGIGVGISARYVLRRATLSTSGLVPVFTLAAALVSYSGTTLINGSGFLAVYLTGVFLNAPTLPYRGGLVRVHAALGWLAQIGMFLMLGLMVLPSELPHVAWIGLAIAVLLAVVARPVAVAICLIPLRFSVRETAFIGWVGLRGAVPIILATFPLMAHLPGAQNIFNIVFFVVVINTIFPGSTIRWATRRLGLASDEKPAPEAVLEINSPRPLSSEMRSYLIAPSVAVCGAKLSDLELPLTAAVMLIVRNGNLVAARGGTALEAGDHVYIFFDHGDRPLIDLLFGRSEEGGVG